MTAVAQGVVGEFVWEIPYVPTAGFPQEVGRSWKLPFGVYGRLPERTGEDMIRSLKKYVAEVLGEFGGAFLVGLDENDEEARSDGWEVRLWDEHGTFRFPFARVARVGPEVSTGPPFYEDLTQPVSIHLYPFAASGREEAELLASRAGQVIHDALRWGARCGYPLSVPLWDYGGNGLYEGSEARHPSDFFRVIDLQVDRIADLEDDRYAAAVINFRAQWRRVPNGVPGHLIESVRVTAHPS